jgi:hypothetical protein
MWKPLSCRRTPSVKPGDDNPESHRFKLIGIHSITKG